MPIMPPSLLCGSARDGNAMKFGPVYIILWMTVKCLLSYDMVYTGAHTL